MLKAAAPPRSNVLAIADAIAFHEAIGAERKLARLVALRDRWARRLSQNDRVRLWPSLAPRRAGAFATFGIDGIKPADLAAHLWSKYRIFVVAITHPQFEGLRVVAYLVPSANGSKYEGRNVTFWSKGDEATVTWMDRELKCSARRAES